MRIRSPLFFRLCLGMSFVILSDPVVSAQEGATAARPATSEIVQRMVAENEQRAQELGTYSARRHYHVDYRGFPRAAEADMIVDAVCNGPDSKRFVVVSESGSPVLLDHVLRKLLRTEQDASQHHSDSALTPENYAFTLLRTEIIEGRQAYVLTVEPQQSRALLYRGTIWVDAQDFAVVKLDAQPSRNPSFWIRDTRIKREYEKAGEFWLPQTDRSEGKIRLGGTAVLTIEYDNYHLARTATNHLPQLQESALP